MRIFLLTLLLLALFCVRCTYEKQSEFVEFSELSAADSVRWHHKMMKALHAEMVDSVKHYTFLCATPVQIDLRNRLIVHLSGDRYFIRNYGDDIPAALFDYYLTNRRKNDFSNNFPMYSHLTMAEIRAGLASAKSELQRVKKQTQDSLMLDYHEHIVREWDEFFRALKVLKTDNLAQINGQALIEVRSRKAHPKTKKQVYAILAESYHCLLDELAKEYFGISYLELFYRSQNRKKQVDLDRMLALRLLVPIKVVDVEYCRVHKCCGYSCEVPPPVNDLPPKRAPEPIDYPESDPIELIDSLQGEE